MKVQPGDIGAATVPNGGEHLVLQLANGAWVCAFSTHEKHPCPVESVRPLVVIDPEDREQVKRLHEAFNDTGWAMGPFTDRLQQALRSLVTPPKPDEPIGLGAVVEDTGGVMWVRVALDCQKSPDWKPSHSMSTRVTYAQIDAVKVLSEGVTA